MREFGLRHLAALGMVCGVATVQAGEVYGSVGFPGVMVGYAHPLTEQLTLRGDFATLGSHDQTRTEEGISYAGRLKTDRVAVFADWFPMAGSFRLTAGLSSNQYKMNLDASGAGRTVQVGDNSYTLGANDGLLMDIRFPSTTPYLGIGWGHQASKDGGVRFAADIGAMIGKATVTATPRGILADDAAKADVAKELAQLRDGVGKVRAIPQLSVSIGYSF